MLSPEQQARLTSLFEGLDPLRLLRQLDRLQDALWQLAVLPTTSAPAAASTSAPLTFQGSACGVGEDAGVGASEAAAPSEEGSAPARQKRKYRRTKPERLPRTWRTRPDPFAEVIAGVYQRLEANPELSAKQLFQELQAEHPGQFPDIQLRTLQRRVAEWRAQAILTFQDQWLAEDQLQSPPGLRGMVEAHVDEGGQEVALGAD